MLCGLAPCALRPSLKCFAAWINQAALQKGGPFPKGQGISVFILEFYLFHGVDGVAPVLSIMVGLSFYRGLGVLFVDICFKVVAVSEQAPSAIVSFVSFK